MLRQEVYADDASAGATPEHEQRARTPYTVTAQCMAVAVLQPQDTNRHAVFFAYPRESITYQYERNPADPRIQHSLHLEVDEFGNVVKQVAVNYGRREPDGTLPADDDRDQQALVHIAYTENSFTNAIADVAEHYRTPMPAESRTFELRRPRQDRSSGGVTRLFRLDDLASVVAEVADGSHDIPCEDREFELAGTAAAHDPAQAHRFFRRLVEHVRTLYRPDDCGTSQNDPLALLALGDLERLALAGDSYKLALTPGLLDQVFQRPRPGQPDESLIPVPEAVLGGISGSGGYVDLDGDGSWWIPTGRVFYHPNEVDAPIELTQARANFFLPRRSRDPFGHDAVVDFDEPYNLLAVESRDALGNRVTAEANDYRVLQPYLVSDPNRNRTQVAFDILGMVVGMAVMGKALPAPPQGDSLGGFVSDLDQWQIDGLLMHPRRSRTAGRESEATPIVHDLISNATTRFVYDVTRYLRLGEPAVSVAVTRETHVSQLRPGQESKLQISFSYSDGFGREIQRKVQATSGPLVPEGVVASPRWVGSGWTIFNNKGKPVRRFEPFFSATHEFEFEAAIGVSPVLFYDPVGRVIVTLHPNHTYEKVVFDAWQQTTYDVNDTSAPSGVQTGDPRDDSDVGRYTEEYFAAQPPDWRTWGAERSDGSLGPHEAAAAARAGAHADTPVTSYLDALGRPFLIVARNRIQCPGHPLDGAEDTVVSRVERDIHGNICVLRDERRLPVNGLPVGSREERTVMRCSYDMNGSRLTEQSMEAGSRWTLGDVTGKAIRSWDSRGHGFATVYDALRRPLERTVFGATDESDPRTRMASGSLLVEKILYGEGQANAEELNLRTGIYRHFDSGGVVTNAQLDDQGVPLVAYDFKGNLLTSRRQLTTAYDVIPDWSQDPQPRLDPEYFEASTSYDALDRPIQSVAPHSNVIRAQHPNRLSILQPVFNDANLLERLDVWLERPATPGSLLDPSSDRPSMIGVTNIDYDAKSQRLMIEYKNGASTNYQYDPLTFRLTRLASRRDSIAFPGDDQQTVGWLGRQVQNLAYTYDPVGNLTHIHDDAQQSIFFKNRRVEPSSDYVYDSVYRLVEATGREHLGQSGGSVPHRYLDVGRVGIRSANASGGFAPNDGNAMGRYTERYVYDAVGNCLQMQHAVAAAGQPGWTRRFDYGEPSQLEPAKQSNRLSRSIVGSDAAEIYTYDAQGNMRSMPQLQAMLWDYEGRLLMTRRQRVNDEDGDGIEHEGERTYYVYDGSGQRLRKVTILGAGAVKDERIYLGDFEVHRVLGDPNDAGHVALERETLHVRDDKQRIAVIETRTLDEMGVDPGPRRLARYQLGNHLGSATLELDEQAKVISYEEYSPFGSTTYQAVRSQTEVAKRYRYTAKERDEESGLNYHGVRYYAPWVGRWISPDAIRFINRYLYCDANPITLVDRDGNAPTGVIESQPDTGAPTAPAPRIVRRQQQAAEDPDPVKTEEELAELQRTHMEHLQKDAYTSDYEPNPQGGAPRINHHVKGCTCIWHDPPAAEKQPDEEPPVEQKSTSVIETRPPKPPAERPKRTAPWIFDPIDIYGHMKAKEQAPVTPPPLLPVNRLYTATDIHFKGFHLWDVVGDVKAEFADESYVVDIGIVAKMMTRHPELHVRVEAYTGCTPALAWAQPSGRTKEAYDRFGRLMDARAKLVQDELVKRGVSRDRIDLSRGAALTGDANRKVEFYFYIK
jgi:RHS repeat-associated protein